PGRRTAQVCAVRCNSRSVLPACTALGSRTPSPSALCSLPYGRSAPSDEKFPRRPLAIQWSSATPSSRGLW
ncbi:hypothetical protein CH063_15159, partial [Colletotrichum higginsianum]